MNGLSHMGAQDGCGSGKIGDAAGDFQNPVISTTGKIEAGYGLLQQFLSGRIERAVAFDLLSTQGGVGFALTRELNVAATHHACPHYSRGFIIALSLQFVRGECRHFYHQVDTIEQRPGKLAPIASDLIRRAATTA